MSRDPGWCNTTPSRPPTTCGHHGTTKLLLLNGVYLCPTCDVAAVSVIKRNESA